MALKKYIVTYGRPDPTSKQGMMVIVRGVTSFHSYLITHEWQALYFRMAL